MDNEYSKNEENSQIFDYYNKTEKKSFVFEALIDAKKLNQADHDLRKNHNFQSESMMKKMSNLISRKNIIYYGIIAGEQAIETSQCFGNVEIPVIDKESISRTLHSVKKSDSDKISYLHVSTIQMMIKSTFSLGIDCPITIRLEDNRMLAKENALIAEGGGNLKYGKIKFNLNYQVGMSLLDSLLNESVTLSWQTKKNLMKDGNHPFTVTWRINYALTNSHHSLTFKPNEKIEVDELFAPILHLEAPQRSFQVSRTKSMVRPRYSLDLPSRKEISLKINKEEPRCSEEPSCSSSSKEIILKQDHRINHIEDQVKWIGKELGVLRKF